MSTLAQWNSLDSGITELTVSYDSLNDASLIVLDLTRFKRLKKIVIGSYSFKSVNEVKMIGLAELESVEIGENSFTQHMNGHDIRPDPNRYFYLKNCPKLKSLWIGSYSFSDYSVIEIENVDALESIAMGGLYYGSYSFQYASLELKSILIHRE